MEISADIDGVSLDGGKLLKSKVKALTLKDMDSIRCGNCNKPLAQVNCSPGKDISYYLIVDCPFCGDHSFGYQVTGMVRMKPAENVGLVDIVLDDERNLTTYKTKKV